MVVALRLVMAVVAGIAGYVLSTRYIPDGRLDSGPYGASVAGAVVVGAFVGFFIGHLLGKAVTRLGRRLARSTSVVTASGLIFTSLGLLLGLAIAALGGLSVKDLPVVGPYLLPVLYAISGYLFAYLGYKRHTDLARVLGFKGLLKQPEEKEFLRPKILDTSAIIDGRVGTLAEMGFIEGDIVVPSFVLEELQSIADSGEAGKRARGRRGLDTVHQLQSGGEHVSIVERDFPSVADVDTKLIKLAKEIKACILTIDSNLNKVCQIQGVEALNLNELGHAMKMAVIPGETLQVRLLREGKEEDQGVAYLEDGTMVVVEGGGKRVGEEVRAEVTSILQNPTGKMVFARMVSS
jgi:uncharacterized protein YacL